MKHKEIRSAQAAKISRQHEIIRKMLNDYSAVVAMAADYKKKMVLAICASIGGAIGCAFMGALWLMKP